ncbi:MAG TPA: hypothetical protein DCO79_16195, partial [Spirochaeta sp.]|nr:hypothetical protein [Spirochaeta sp.]
MRETLLLIWKKSPVRILLVLAVLLTALGYFENAARTLRNRDIVIEIVGGKNNWTAETPADGTGEEEFPVGGHSANMAEWYARLKIEHVGQVRSEWELFKQEWSETLPGDFFFF